MSEKIKTKIVGVTFKNEDGMERQDLLSMLSAGDTLSLKDTSSDKYPEAIGVFNSDDEQLGSLRKDLAISLRQMEGDFESFPVSVLEVTGGGDKSLGCNIVITPDDFFTCHITVKDNGGLEIKTPLLNTPNSIIPSSVGQIKLVKVDESYSVLSKSGECVGILPPFACEHITKRNLDIISCSGSVFDCRTDSDGDLHIGILINLSPKKSSDGFIAAQNVNDHRSATAAPPRPNRFENLTPSSDQPIMRSSSNAPSQKKKTGFIQGILVAVVLFLIIFFVAPYILSTLSVIK